MPFSLLRRKTTSAATLEGLPRLQQLLWPFACYRDARATASEQTRMSAQASNAYRRMSGSDDAGSSSQHAYTEPIKEV